MIIGISGKAQSGKDTAGLYLTGCQGFTRVASADALKRIAMRTFNWDGQKDERGRKFLQDLATAVRNYDPDFWIKITLQEIENRSLAKDFVITDVRYKNEANLLKEKGAILIRIEREGIKKYDHPSETELDDYEGFDYRIYNNGTIEELESVLKNILIDIRR